MNFKSMLKPLSIALLAVGICHAALGMEKSENQNLLDAAAKGNIEMVLLALDNADINCTNDNGDTPLHIASRHNHPEIAKLLLDHGADIKRENIYNELPLYIAFSENHLQIIKLLLSHEADINRITNECNGYTPLHEAILIGQQDLVHILLDLNAKINCTDNYGQTPLHLASKNNTPLHLASKNNYADIVKLLLDYGADINCIDKDGDTPLHTASNSNHKKIAKILINHGVNIDYANIDGDTCLHRASVCNFTQITKLLLKRGANINLANKNGDTALDVAMFHGNTAIISLIEAELEKRKMQYHDIILARLLARPNDLKLDNLLAINRT